MLAKDLLNTDFVPLEAASVVSAALAKMDAWQTTALPVIEPSTKKVIGQVHFRDVADQPDESVKISEMYLSPPVYVFEDHHVFDVGRQMTLHEMDILPVVDHTESYLGIIEKRSVLDALSGLLNLEAEGTVITVMLSRADFSLTEMVHLIETEGGKILGIGVEQQAGGKDILEISFKLNTPQSVSARILASFQRHGYTTTTGQKDDLIRTDMISRADELIRYLDV